MGEWVGTFDGGYGPRTYAHTSYETVLDYLASGERHGVHAAVRMDGPCGCVIDGDTLFWAIQLRVQWMDGRGPGRPRYPVPFIAPKHANGTG